MAKPSFKAKAIELRKKGYSYNYIKTKVAVSKGTLSQWLSLVSYVPNEETLRTIGKARTASILAKHREKLASLNAARQQAKKDLGSLSKRDIFMLGIGLYMGEGSKTGDMIRIINSNQKIISFAILWFKEVCNLKNDNFKIRLHVYPDNDIDQCLKFWSKETSIPIGQFQKTQVDTRKNKKKSNQGKLPYGTAHLSIVSNGKKEFGVFLARRIRAWMELVLN